MDGLNIPTRTHPPASVRADAGLAVADLQGQMAVLRIFLTHGDTARAMAALDAADSAVRQIHAIVKVRL